MMQKFGLTIDDKDKILSLGCGCFIRKSDETAFDEMFKRHKQEMQDAIASDKTGDGFIYDMFIYELANHEYCITYDLEETLNANKEKQSDRAYAKAGYLQTVYTRLQAFG